jgi:transposase
VGKTKGKAGRPTTLTPDVARDLAAAYSTGIGLSHAARCVKIPVRTVYEWFRRGKEQPDSQFGEFRRQMREALSASILRAAEAKQRVDPGWWLGHMDAKRWGNKSKIEVDANVKSEHKFVVIMPPLKDDG